MTFVAVAVVVSFVVYLMTAEERRRAVRIARGSVRGVLAAVRMSRPDPKDPFYDELRARMRWPLVTYVVVAVNLGLFAAMLYGAGTAADHDTLLAWGANFGPRTTNGERWRLFTSLFLHAGLLPLLINTVALAELGRVAERVAGHLTFAIVYLAAGVLGSVVLIAGSPTEVFAGSTAAVFGTAGLLLAISIRSLLRRLPIQVPLRAVLSVAPAVLVFVTYHVATESIYALAKLGLCTGLVAGIVLTRQVSDDGIRVRRYAALTAAAALIVFMAAMAVRVVSDIRPDVAAVMAVEERTTRAYDSAVQRFRKGQGTARELVQVIEQSIVPELQGATKRVSALGNVPSRDEPLLEYTHQYLQLREESWRLRAEALRKVNMGTLRQADEREQASLRVFDKVKSEFVAQ
jgi:rhomboid protease GluP